MSRLFASGDQSYWSFSFSISPSNEYSGLISFRTDWLDLLAVQGTLKSPVQHHSSKASVLQCSAFFMVQLSHPYMTTGNNTALTIHTFVSKDPFIDQITTNRSEPCVNPVASHQTQRKNPEQVRTQCIQLSTIISDG